MQTRGHCKALGRFGFGFWVPRQKPMHEDGPQNALHPPSPFQPAPKGGFGAGAPHPRAVGGGDGFGASPKWLIGGHQPFLWALHLRCNTTAPSLLHGHSPSGGSATCRANLSAACCVPVVAAGTRSGSEGATFLLSPLFPLSPHPSPFCSDAAWGCPAGPTPVSPRRPLPFPSISSCSLQAKPQG